MESQRRIGDILATHVLGRLLGEPTDDRTLFSSVGTARHLVVGLRHSERMGRLGEIHRVFVRRFSPNLLEILSELGQVGPRYEEQLQDNLDRVGSILGSASANATLTVEYWERVPSTHGFAFGHRALVGVWMFDEKRQLTADVESAEDREGVAAQRFRGEIAAGDGHAPIRAFPLGLPPSVTAALARANSLKDRPGAYANALRCLLECVCEERGIAGPNLAARLRTLADSQHAARDRFRLMARFLREFGNVGSHDPEGVHMKDVPLMAHLCHVVLDFVYTAEFLTQESSAAADRHRGRLKRNASAES